MYGVFACQFREARKANKKLDMGVFIKMCIAIKTSIVYKCTFASFSVTMGIKCKSSACSITCSKCIEINQPIILLMRVRIKQPKWILSINSYIAFHRTLHLIGIITNCYELWWYIVLQSESLRIGNYYGIYINTIIGILCIDYNPMINILLFFRCCYKGEFEELSHKNYETRDAAITCPATFQVISGLSPMY